VKQSPELLNAILNLQAQGIQVEAAGEIINIETDVQEIAGHEILDKGEPNHNQETGSPTSPTVG
jgi:hypothetical protein